MAKKKATKSARSKSAAGKATGKSKKAAGKKSAKRAAKPTTKKTARKVAVKKTAAQAKRSAQKTTSKAKARAPKSDVERRMRQLEQEIEYHRHLYYVNAAPEISDREFDRLFTELEELEAAHPKLARKDSPTQRVGSDLSAGDAADGDAFPRIKHTIQVLSLSNSYSTEDALEWAGKIEESGKSKVLVQWKIDGATLVLYYKDGVLDKAVTRGTGQTGDDVSHNARTIGDIPHTLKKKITGAVRGEVYMTFDEFEKYNEEVGSIYANPRNLSAGSLKHKDPTDTARRPLRYMAFDGHFPDQTLKTDGANVRMLRDLGLPTFQDTALVPVAKLEATIEDFRSRKEAVGYPVDGLVLKVDTFSVREEMGFTAAHPRWATALKFEPEIAETTVKAIEVFVGRTGRVTPRASLEPVQLAGTTVQHATLHNADFIKKLGVNVGARVKISKRGEIIPAVEEVVKPGKGRAFRFPKKCPVCKTGLEREKAMVDWLCPNPECDEKVVTRLIFFAQRKQMDISGMGEKIVRVLFDNGFIRTIPDIYRLPARAAELEELEGFGQKSVQVLLKGIAESKERPFALVLPALGLREVGPKVTEGFIDAGYDSIEKILELVRSEDALKKLKDVDGIGKKIAGIVSDQFQQPGVLKLIEELQAAGLRFAAPERESGPQLPQTMSGQSWCVTGSFDNFKPRDLATAEIKRRGGKVVSGVSQKTTYLLAGAGAGSKLAKAEKHGVAIVTEDDFLKMLAESSEPVAT